jgi:hypothetical protein
MTRKLYLFASMMSRKIDIFCQGGQWSPGLGVFDAVEWRFDRASRIP